MESRGKKGGGSKLGGVLVVGLGVVGVVLVMWGVESGG